MTTIFLADEIKNSNYKFSKMILNREVIKWLSANLRRRPNDKNKRYNYIRHKFNVWERSKNIIICGKPYIKKTYSIGVKIYDKTDAMAFKLRWL